jgi:hypothetical protein
MRPGDPPPLRPAAQTTWRHPLDAARAALGPAYGPAAIVAVLLAAALAAHLLLGDGLGVHGAWMTLLLAVALFAILVVVDAGRPGAGDSQEEAYDLTSVGLTAGAIVAAVACLYLPMPWGGLGAAAVLVGLVAALRLPHDS